MKKKLAIFASGTGTNFEAIARACLDGRLEAEAALMICDKPGAAVIDKAVRLGVKSFVFSPKDYASKAEYEEHILILLQEEGIDLICLAGYMRVVSEVLLNAYPDRIINIHPSLLPSFKGLNAVEQAVEYGVKVYGITVHYVNSDLDGGRIIAQKAFEYEGNDPEEVHRIGQKIEHQLYIDSIRKVLSQ